MQIKTSDPQTSSDKTTVTIFLATLIASGFITLNNTITTTAACATTSVATYTTVLRVLAIFTSESMVNTFPMHTKSILRIVPTKHQQQVLFTGIICATAPTTYHTRPFSTC